MATFEAFPNDAVTSQIKQASAEFELRMSALDGTEEAALSNVAEKIHLAQLILDMCGVRHTGTDVVSVASMIFRQMDTEARATVNEPETVNNVVDLGAVRAH